MSTSYLCSRVCAVCVWIVRCCSEWSVVWDTIYHTFITRPPPPTLGATAARPDGTTAPPAELMRLAAPFRWWKQATRVGNGRGPGRTTDVKLCMYSVDSVVPARAQFSSFDGATEMILRWTSVVRTALEPPRSSACRDPSRSPDAAIVRLPSREQTSDLRPPTTVHSCLGHSVYICRVRRPYCTPLYTKRAVDRVSWRDPSPHCLALRCARPHTRYNIILAAVVIDQRW